MYWWCTFIFGWTFPFKNLCLVEESSSFHTEGGQNPAHTCDTGYTCHYQVLPRGTHAPLLGLLVPYIFYVSVVTLPDLFPLIQSCFVKMSIKSIKQVNMLETPAIWLAVLHVAQLGLETEFWDDFFWCAVCLRVVPSRLHLFVFRGSHQSITFPCLFFLAPCWLLFSRSLSKFVQTYRHLWLCSRNWVYRWGFKLAMHSARCLARHWCRP